MSGSSCQVGAALLYLLAATSSVVVVVDGFVPRFGLLSVTVSVSFSRMPWPTTATSGHGCFSIRFLLTHSFKSFITIAL